MTGGYLPSMGVEWILDTHQKGRTDDCTGYSSDTVSVYGEEGARFGKIACIFSRMSHVIISYSNKDNSATMGKWSDPAASGKIRDEYG